MKVGLEIELIGLAQEDRTRSLDPAMLSRHVEESIAVARGRRQFAAKLEEVASRVRKKVDRDRSLW
jgi:hypothetical protein